MFLFGDMTFLLLIPVLILAFWAQNKVKSNYKKFDKTQNSAGLSGRDVARRMLDNNNLTDVEVNAIEGELTDHFDPRKRVVNLSKDVYHNSSVSAISIAAHECGHAVQHAREYLPAKIRSAIVPVASFGSQAAFPLFIIGLFANIGILMDLGIIFFSGALLFHLVTLPVEYDASKIGLKTLRNNFSLSPDDLKGSKAVLNAAALTYVASTLMALVQLIRLIVLRGARD